MQHHILINTTRHFSLPALATLAMLAQLSACASPAADSGDSSPAADTSPSPPQDTAAAGSDTTPTDALSDVQTPDTALQDVPDATTNGGDAAATSDSSDASMAEYTDCFTVPDGKDYCCTTNPSTDNQSICYPAPAKLDGGVAASGGCGAGKIKTFKGCQDADCFTVYEFIGMTLNASLVPNSQACTTDHDCVAVDLSAECQPACPIGVHKQHVETFKQAIAKVDKEVCAPFSVTKVCKPSPLVGPCAKTPTPGCVKGKCTAYKQYPTNDCASPKPTGATCYLGKWKCDAPGYALPPGYDSCIKTTCSNVESVLAGILKAAITPEVKACSSVDDCQKWKPSGFCAPFCPVAVNKTKSYGLSKVASKYFTFCKVNYDTVCPYKPPSCPGAGTLACENKQCVLKTAP